MSRAGLIVAQNWREISLRFQDITADTLVVMPDHVHGVLLVNEGEPRPGQRASHSISELVSYFKSFTAREINRRVFEGRQGTIWQRGFYDRVIRNERELNAARDYVVTNPLRWWLKRLEAGGS